MVERARRLRREYEVQQARSQGRSSAAGPLVARIHPNSTHPETNRFAVVAGKRVGGAVARNRLKRLVREAIRHLDPSFKPGHDIVVIVRGDRDEMPSLAVAEASLSTIARRAGLIAANRERVASGADQSSPRDCPMGSGLARNDE